MNVQNFLTRLVVAGLVLPGAAFAQSITNFGEDVGFGPLVPPGSGWIYTGSNSTVTGSNTNGSSLLGTFPTTVDFSGANVITLTANAADAPGSSFLLTLFDQSNGTSSAVFTWEQLLSGATVTSSMTPILPGTMQNVNSWRLLSIYSGGSPAPMDVTFSSAVAGYQAPAPSGIGGPVLTSFGSGVTSSGTWSFSAATNTVSGTPEFGDSLSGNAVLSNYSSPTQISLTASAVGVSNAPFTYVVTDNNLNQAYAAFDWSNFASGPTTITADLVTDSFFDPTNVVSWTILSGTEDVAVNATLFGAGLVSSAQHETVLDNFSVGAAPINVNDETLSSNTTVTIEGWTMANREMTASAGSGSIVNAGVENGEFGVVGTGPSQIYSSLVYTDFTLYAPDQTFLQIDFTETNNLNFLSIILGSSNSSMNLEGIFSVANGTAQSYFIDLAALAINEGIDPASFLAGLNNAEFVFGTTEAAFFANVDRVVLTTLPEPSTAGMIFGAVLALWGIRGRTRPGQSRISQKA